MATFHDVMPVFELFQPTSIDETLTLLDKYKRDAWVLAGGLDTFDWLKDRNKRPKIVVDLSGVQELQCLHETILGKNLVRANFQRKILSMEILERMDKKYTGGAHKAPYLYRFKAVDGGR